MVFIINAFFFNSFYGQIEYEPYSLTTSMIMNTAGCCLPNLFLSVDLCRDSEEN